MEHVATQSPWHFLSPLSGDSATDRELIDLTRKDELAVITHMVAASEASILYAFSGNGKTSLLNAGVIPFFEELGYAVFTTRPRPPWSTRDPIRAFKECLLLDDRLPLINESDLVELRATLELVDSISEDADGNGSVRRLLSKVEILPFTVRGLHNLRGRFEPYLEQPMAVILREIQELLTADMPMLIICDQFEELFVHYSNTPTLQNFAVELGQVWADDSLNVHFLFSMREDWVGSMIELRDTIPEIFSYTYKLNPISLSRAKDVFLHPLMNSGIDIAEREAGHAADRIVADLAEAYSLNQRDRYAGLRLTPSPTDDPFVELPALQVVADTMWETKDARGPWSPFTVEHYEALPGLVVRDVFTASELDTNGEHVRQLSPAQIVLEDYIEDHLAKVSVPANADDKSWRDLQLDCLFVLTDGTRHRRAMTIPDLLQSVNRMRPKQLDLPNVGLPELRQVLDPLIVTRLVRQNQGQDGHSQIELAHDFAVRSVVKKWRLVDRARTAEMAVRAKERRSKDRQLERLTRAERRSLRVLQVAPAFSLLALLFFIISTFLGDHYQNLVAIGALILTPMILSLGILVISGQRVGLLFGALWSGSLLMYFYVISGMRDSYGYYSEDWLFTDLGLLLLLVLWYCRISSVTAERLSPTSFARHVFSILSSELADLFATVTLFVGGVTAMALIIYDEAYLLFGAMVLYASLVLLPALWLYRSGKTIGFFWGGYRIEAREGRTLTYLRAVWRQLLFVIWSTLNVFFLLPSLVVGPFIMWYTDGHLPLYDVVAGTRAVEREDRSHAPSFGGGAGDVDGSG